MKICPFLVAGQESLHLQPSTVAGREATRLGPRAEESRDPQEAMAPKSNTAATGLWAIEEDDDNPSRALECLGEPCRFFHDGGCRFDALFASGTPTGLGAGGLLLQEGDADGPSLASVLQEVWSLQRENLKEMIGGFRRLEAAQSQEQEGLAGKIDGLSSRFDEARSSSPELVDHLDRRFEALQRCVTTLQESLQATFGGSAADLGSQIDGLRQEILKNQTSLETTRSEFDATRAEIAKTHGEVERTRAEIAKTHGEVERTRAEIAKSQDVMSQSVQETLEKAILTLQEQLTATRRDLSATATETRTRMQELVEQNSASSRAELEHSLQRVLDDNQHMQELREEFQSTLQKLADQVQDVAAAASTLATASQRTEALAAEQRAYSEAMLERERHDEARRLNNAGVLAYHEGAYDTSVQKFREALEQDPSLAEAWNNLGLSCTEMHQDDEALEAYKKALELNPHVGQVYNNLGYLYHRRGELEQAVEMYERATVRATDTSAAWSNLANALYALQRVDEAVGAWRRAVELDPANDKASRALERLGLETSH